MPRHRRPWFVHLVAFALMVPACTGSILSVEESPRVDSPLPVSGASPFHDCSVGQPIADSEVEPSLAIDPEDPERLVAAWQQDRNFRGGALGILTASSTDGGRTWDTATPALTACAGGPYDLASDPAVSVGPDRSYLATIGIDVIGSGSPGGSGEEAERGGFDTEVAVAASVDGTTWGRPVVVGTSADARIAFDKETIQADPRVAGRAWVAWVQYTSSGDGPPKTNQAFVSRTTDGGVTWSTPSLMYGANTETQFHQLVALPGGALLDAFLEAPTLSSRPPFAARLAVIRSTDAGATWSAPVTAASISFTAVTDPTGKSDVRGTGQGILAAAGPDGAVYVAWAEQHEGAESFLAVVRSDDGGRTWSPPSRVLSSTTGQPFVPQVAVSGGGRVGVSWYQLERGENDELSTQVWLAWSEDRADSWQSIRLAGPFDLHTAPLSAEGDFVGDYEGLVGTPRGFGALYAMAQPPSRDGPTDIFFSRADLGM